MNMNEEMLGVSSVRLTMPMYQKSVSVDVSEDFTLPDYQPEIRRVLYVSAKALPPARFVSGGNLDVNGIADFTLVYIGADGEICSAPLSCEYAFSQSIDGFNDFETGEGVTVMAHAEAESASVRVSAPRKLQVRGRVRLQMCVWGKMLCEEKTEGITDPSSVRRLAETAECADVLCESSDLVTLYDEYELASGDTGVILADSSVCISSKSRDGEIVRIGGEVILRMLLRDGEGECERVIRKLPFETEIALDGLGDDSNGALCSVIGTVTDTVINVEEGKVVTQVNLTLHACLSLNRTVEYAKDIYSIKQLCDSEVRSISLPRMLKNHNAELSLTERVSAEECGIADGAEIIYITGSAIAEELAAEDGKCVLRGSCHYNVLCKKDGEYSASDVRLPFKYECDIPDTDISGYQVYADIVSCRGRRDGDFINIDSEMSLGVKAWGTEEKRMLGRASFGEKREALSGAFVVCYPSGDETLWDIAKRYGVAQESVSGNVGKDSFVIIEA